MCDQTSEKVGLLEAKFRARPKRTDIPYWRYFEKFFNNVGHPNRDYETRDRKVPHIGRLAKSYTNVRNPPNSTEFHLGMRSTFSSVCQCFF